MVPPSTVRTSQQISSAAARSRARLRSSLTGQGSLRQPSAFISYAASDGADQADRLDRDLRSHGVETWLCARDMYEAVDFTAELERAIDSADQFIACITFDVKRPDSYVRREIAYAQLRGKPIAVVRFVPALPPISVVTHTFFEFYRDWDAAFDRLLVFCRGGEATPARDR